MKTTPDPRELVATFVHPMPMTALAAIGQLVEQVYGTGETSLRFADDRVMIFAPAEGFGPRPTDSPAPVVQDSSLLTQRVDYRGDELEMDVTGGPEVAGAIGGTMRAWLDQHEAVNFVTMRLAVHDSDDQYTFTVGRPGRPSPAELYIEARDRLAAIESALGAVDRDTLPAPLRDALAAALPTG